MRNEIRKILSTPHPTLSLGLNLVTRSLRLDVSLGGLLGGAGDGGGDEGVVVREEFVEEVEDEEGCRAIGEGVSEHSRRGRRRERGVPGT